MSLQSPLPRKWERHLFVPTSSLRETTLGVQERIWEFKNGFGSSRSVFAVRNDLSVSAERRSLRGPFCRFADDFILCFQYREDAEKVLDVLRKRFEKYGLKLHPDKTRLMDFGRKALAQSRNRVGRSRQHSIFSDSRTSVSKAGRGISRFMYLRCASGYAAV